MVCWHHPAEWYLVSSRFKDYFENLVKTMAPLSRETHIQISISTFDRRSPNSPVRVPSYFPLKEMDSCAGCISFTWPDPLSPSSSKPLGLGGGWIPVWMAPLAGSGVRRRAGARFCSSRSQLAKLRWPSYLPLSC